MQQCDPPLILLELQALDSMPPPPENTTPIAPKLQRSEPELPNLSTGASKPSARRFLELRGADWCLVRVLVLTPLEVIDTNSSIDRT